MIQKKYIYLAIIILVIITSTILIFYFLQKKSTVINDHEILVNSNYPNSTVSLYLKAGQYVAIQSADAPINFTQIPAGIYMVAVSIKDSDVCPYTEIVDLSANKKAVVNAEINLSQSCIN